MPVRANAETCCANERLTLLCCLEMQKHHNAAFDSLDISRHELFFTFTRPNMNF